MRKDEIIDLLTENALNERLARIIENDEKLKAAKVRAMDLFNKLLTTLSEKQKELFDWFMTANAEEQARMEYLIYRQGLKDMKNLNESLQNNETGCEEKQTVLEIGNIAHKAFVLVMNASNEQERQFIEDNINMFLIIFNKAVLTTKRLLDR